MRHIGSLLIVLAALAGCGEGEPAVDPEPPPVPGEPGELVGPGSDSKPGMLAQGRVGASATVTAGGKIVIIGGVIPKPDADPHAVAAGDPSTFETILDTAEVYDPATGTVTPLSTDPASPQTLFYPRAFHQALLLPGSGRIIVSGGYTQLGDKVSATANVEVFNIDKTAFLAPDAVPQLSRARVHHTASLLDYRDSEGEGEVLVLAAGGMGEASHSYDVWSPQEIVTSGAIPVAPRWSHRAVNVEGFYTFLVGGEDEDSTISAIEVFDKEEGQFLPNGNLPESLKLGGRVGHAIAYDPEMRAVFVAGGYSDKARSKLEPHIEVISTETGFGLAPPSSKFLLNKVRAHHAAAFLKGGRILVSGGLSSDGSAVGDTEVLGEVGTKIAASLHGVLNPARFAHRSVGMSEDTAVLIGGASPVAGGGLTLVQPIEVLRL